MLDIERDIEGEPLASRPAVILALPVRSGQQTTRNFAWRDYGNRIGNWRLFDSSRDPCP
jgi:hypothetical protein